MKLYSEPGHGTTVKVYLPRSMGRLEGEWITRPRPGLAAGGKPGELLLVVEDEQGVRRSSAEALRDLGYDVLEAEDGAHGVRLLDAHPGVKLLFTDVVMPDMNGRRLAEGARAGPAACAVHHRLHAQRHRAQRPTRLGRGLVAQTFHGASVGGESARCAGPPADRGHMTPCPPGAAGTAGAGAPPHQARMDITPPRPSLTRSAGEPARM